MSSKITGAAFAAMMRPPAIGCARSFLAEEVTSVERFVISSVRTLVALGDATFAHVAAAQRQGVGYVAVDPRDGLEPRGVRHLRSSFEALRAAELPAGPRGYVFSFNLWSYLTRPLGALYRLLEPGDLVCASTWTPGCPERSCYMRALTLSLGRPLPEMDSDPCSDFAHLAALMTEPCAPWQCLNPVSTQTIFRCPT